MSGQPMRAEDRSTRQDELAGWPVRITSHRIGEIYYASVDNVDPGATIARASASTREEAEGVAVEKARSRLAQTRRMPAE
ncbi:MAG TPA: hypothetical protein VFQ38_24700 [Longimicrobiales bacterium]|nr:hypothetical protein [Longimicrobiales bacterium]